MAGQRHLAFMLGRVVHGHAQPIRLEGPSAVPPLEADATDHQLALRQADRLVHAGVAEIPTEGVPDSQDVEPEEAEDRPCSLKPEETAHRQAYGRESAHEDGET